MATVDKVRDVRVLRRADQVQSSVAGGVFRTNKPVVGGRTADGQPSAALFYWSHGQFSDDFEFGLHRHEGFEVMSVVLHGDNSHYDTTTKRWTTLTGGDIQVIRSGSGMAHNERVGRGNHGFQIWFDPGFDEARRRPPSYTDYPAAAFTSHQEPGAIVTDCVGGAGPIEMHTEGLMIRRLRLDGTEGPRIDLGPDRFTVAYVIDGTASFDGAALERDDAIALRYVDAVTVEGPAGTDVFVISLPAQPGYEPVRQG